MKKIALLLTIAILATAAFAATKPAKPAAAAPAPVVQSVAIQPAPAAKPAGMIIGIDSGNPFMRFMLSSDTAVDVGAGYNSVPVGGASWTYLTVWGRYQSRIATYDKLNTYWGGMLTLNSNNTEATSNAITASVLVGAEYTIVDKLGLYGNINLASLTNTSTGGTSTNSYTILSGNFYVVSGFVVYL
jgi:hypothetical protein